ncbi:MAG: MCE family protein [Mycobacteriales bacterium]
MHTAPVLLRRVLGLVFIAILAGMAAVTVGIYDKAFTSYVPVTLVTDHVGNQLSPPADVKVRGLVVGEVRSIHTNGTNATIKLALQPSKVGLIPSNVTAQLLPKTLFGEKYVSLVIPRNPSPEPFRAHARIGQDRTRVAIETEKVLDDVLPLLQTIRPEKLKAALDALGTALDGRGEQLGQTLDVLDTYLKGFNPQLPTLQHDLQQLAAVSDTYNQAAPDLLATLRDLSVTGNTLVDQRKQLDTVLTQTVTFAQSTEVFLAAHEQRLIQVSKVNRPTLALLARYSPEFPCLLRGLSDSEPRLESVFGGPGTNHTLHITLEVVRDQGPYKPGRDNPAWGAHSGPNCEGLPNPPVPAPEVRFPDGYHGTGAGTLGRPLTGALTDPNAATDMGYAGTQEEQGVVNALLGPVMGVPDDKVPPIATLLFGPMARGTEVTVQ